MKNITCIALLLLSAIAVAGEAPRAKVKIDLATVVEAGAVEAVGGVTSSGQPDEAALQVFKDSGYVAVIDLRGANEDRGLDEEVAVESLGMDYVNLPVSGRDAIGFENAQKLDEIMAAYEGPVLIHCGSGNRAGALLALRASLNGADDETALAIGQAAGLTRAQGLVEERLQDD